VLIYHPAFDIYHGVFRLLRLLRELPKGPTELERVRILDFYLLFPQLLRGVRFPAGSASLKNYFSRLPGLYEQIEDPKALFARLAPYQQAALDALASRRLIDAEALSQSKVMRTEIAIPLELERAIAGRNADSKVIQFLTGPLSRVSLYGPKGLKERTDLFEYRYDAA
jgi:hypothetical protein